MESIAFTLHRANFVVVENAKSPVQLAYNTRISLPSLTWPCANHEINSYYVGSSAKANLFAGPSAMLNHQLPLALNTNAIERVLFYFFGGLATLFGGVATTGTTSVSRTHSLASFCFIFHQLPVL